MALPLGETDKAIGLMECFSACFRDERNPIFVVHEIETLVASVAGGIRNRSPACSGSAPRSHRRGCRMACRPRELA